MEHYLACGLYLVTSLSIPLFQIVEWINEAGVSTDLKVKVENIHKIQELLINQNPHLLDSFLDDVLAFQSDRNMEVRRTVVGFIEESW